MRPVGRPSGKKDKKPRAAYGSKKGVPPGLKITVGDGIDRFSAEIQSNFQEFDKFSTGHFRVLLNTWTKETLYGALRKAIKQSTWQRSRKLVKDTDTKLTSFEQTGDNSIKAVASAIVPTSDDGQPYGITQEFGRESAVTGAGGSGKTYMVPLASWVAANGQKGSDKNFMTKAQIQRDLAKPGVFFPKKEYETKAGKARIFFIYKAGQYPKVTRDTRGRKVTRGQLQKVAIAMYLAYKGATGIYGASKANRKIPRIAKSPLAAQFGLTSTSDAPRWFSVGATNALAALQIAINKVKIEYEALGGAIRVGGISAEEKNGGFSFGLESIKDLSADVFDQVEKNLREEQAGGSHWYDDEE